MQRRDAEQEDGGWRMVGVGVEVEVGKGSGGQRETEARGFARKQKKLTLRRFLTLADRVLPCAFGAAAQLHSCPGYRGSPLQWPPTALHRLAVPAGGHR